MTARQVPSAPATSHASHCPVQTDPQHTESTQNALEHSLAAAHDPPFAFLASQAPVLSQNDPLVQSPSVAHVVLHAAPPASHT